ncbi:MAG: serine hydrolase domain-containing protein [Candidatus Stygibacter frigidus]|nr:serine hydrolase domain-containing protein [Candidatus Stygibacter frigidus]
MLNRNFIIILTLMILLLISSEGIARGEQMISQKELIEEVESSLRAEYYVNGDSLISIMDKMKELKIPGLSLAVIDNFEVVWAKGYGIADIETNKEVDVNTIFQAASISKPFTAYAAMKLVQENKVELNKDINTYLKTWKLLDNNFTETKKVTFKNLLSHNAGTNIHGFPGYKPYDTLPTLDQILNGVSPANTNKVIVDIEPETVNRYSGGGYIVVQKALIDITGKPFEEFMQNQVLKPLELQNSFFSPKALTEEQKLNATAGHYSDGSKVIGDRHIYPEMAAAGLWTTAEDLAKFAVEIQKALKSDSGKILSKQYTQMMMTPVLNGEYNIGFGNEEYNDEPFFEHAGGNEGYACFLTFHKEKGYGFALMVNSSSQIDILFPLFRSIDKAYSWGLFNSGIYNSDNISVPELQRFVGRYKVSFDRSIQFYIKNKKLFYKMSFNMGSELTPVGSHTFISSDRNNKIEFSKELNSIIFNNDTFNKIPDEAILLENFITGNDIIGAQKWLEEQESLKNLTVNELEDYFNDIGYFLISNSKFKEATFYLKLNTVLFDNSANAWDSLGEVYFFSGNYELSIETMKKALVVNPQNQNAKQIIMKAQKLLENE